MFGFMSTGATKVVQKNNLPMGMMGTGAVRKFKKERPLVEKNKVEIAEVIEKKIVVEVPSNVESLVTQDYASMHVKTLKKMAVEKGYTGDKFDKQSLIDFLNSNLCSTQETTKPLSE